MVPNEEDIVAYLNDRRIPADEITLNQIAQSILNNPPLQGYLTISNALQWRLQYGRVVKLKDEVKGISKLIDKINLIMKSFEININDTTILFLKENYEKLSSLGKANTFLENYCGILAFF